MNFDPVVNVLTSTLAFAFALGVIIVVHEAGHLLVAKAFGVRVLTFSVGFGKRLWGFRRGETEYRVSAVPLGGYVRLGGENAEESTGDPREFLSRPRWQRVLVYLAGPAMNVVLAIVLFAALFMVGIPTMSFPDMPPVLSGVEEGSSAAQAGLRRGDRIAAIDGNPVENWHDALITLLTSGGRPLRLTIDRGGKTFDATVKPTKDPRSDRGDTAGMLLALRPQIIQVVGGTPAQAAGFRSGDQIRYVKTNQQDGRVVTDREDFIAYIEKRAGQRIEIEIVRDGKSLVLPVVPRDEGGVGKIGVQVGFYQRYGPARAVVESLRFNVQIVKDTFSIIGKIFSRKMSPKGALAGPLEIAKQSGEAARAGFKELLYMMGFISISIAIMNLMPIPILDGGHIFILAIEGVIRRDLSLRLKEVVSQVGFVLIVLLMAMVLWFDVQKF